MNKHRFNYLLEQYKQDSINQKEYSELVDLLNDTDSEETLDQVLTRYWQEIGQVPSLKKQKPSRLKNSRKWFINPLWGVAASVLLLVGIFFYFWGATEIMGKRELVYSTGFGERLEIELDDGSHVTLNANSELRWSDDWVETEDRQAILTGEAFFEVKKQHGIPFTVNTNDVAVEVLGTSFNVDSREEKTEVYLDEGKVNLKLKDDVNDKNRSEQKQILMKPGDQVRYSVIEKIVEKSEGRDMISAASWKKNVLNFKDMQFSEVLELLRDVYGQSFECTDGQLLKKPMYIGVPYSDWDAVRQALELSLNIEFQKIDKRRYTVRSTKK